MELTPFVLLIILPNFTPSYGKLMLIETAETECAANEKLSTDCMCNKVCQAGSVCIDGNRCHEACSEDALIEEACICGAILNIKVPLCLSGNTCVGSECLSGRRRRREGSETKTCLGNCNNNYRPSDPCQCNSRCGEFNNCCPDYKDQCLVNNANLCSGKECGDVCDTSDGMLLVMRYCQPDGSCTSNARPQCQECSCNSICSDNWNGKPLDWCYVNKNSGCSDKKKSTNRLALTENQSHWSSKACKSETKTCLGNCNNNYRPSDPCQCNSRCGEFNNCCPDYKDQCLVTNARRRRRRDG